jgi:hypothetical protein
MLQTPALTDGSETGTSGAVTTRSLPSEGSSHNGVPSITQPVKPPSPVLSEGRNRDDVRRHRPVLAHLVVKLGRSWLRRKTPLRESSPADAE